MNPIDRLRAAHADPEGHDGLTWDPVTTELVGHALAEIDHLRSEIDRLRSRKKVPSDEAANDLFEALGLELDDGEPSWLDESDDPKVLRECLHRQWLAAAGERVGHEARAIVAEIQVDPDDALHSRLIIATPTGDRAHEREIGARLIRIAVACSMMSRFERGLIQGVRNLVPKVASGEVSAHEAWKRIIDVLSEESAEEDKRP